MIWPSSALGSQVNANLFVEARVNKLWQLYEFCLTDNPVIETYFIKCLQFVGNPNVYSFQHLSSYFVNLVQLMMIIQAKQTVTTSNLK